MSDDLMVNEGKTLTGQLDFKMAAAACYLPVSFLHVIAAVVFLATEPREHRFVRFHAVQSLLLFAVLGGGAMISLFGGMLVLPAFIVVFASVLGGVITAASDEVGAVVMSLGGLLAMASYVIGALLGILLSFAFLPSMGGTAVLVMTGSQGRWPVLGRLADRFVPAA